MTRALSLGCAALAVIGLLLLGAQLLFLFPDGLQFGSRAATLMGVAGFVLVRLAAALLGSRRADKLLANLLLLAFTTLLGLTACELALRFAFRDVTTTVDFQSYFTTRWRQGVHLNALGFRDDDIPGTKPERVYRIVVIGDSFTYGQGVETAVRFTERLEAELNSAPCAGIHYDVINLGRPGAETVDHLTILRDIALSQDPDFILLQWYENDVEGDDKSGRPRPMRLLPSDYLTTWLRENSVLFYMLQSRWGALQGALGWLEPYQDYMRRRFEDPLSPASQAATRALEFFFAETADQDIPMGMILFPDPGGQRDLEFLHRRVLDQCREAGIACVDLQDAFAAVANRQSLWASRLDHHPGAEAHRLAADLLLETFAATWRGACVAAGSTLTPAGAPAALSAANAGAGVRKEPAEFVIRIAFQQGHQGQVTGGAGEDPAHQEPPLRKIHQGFQSHQDQRHDKAGQHGSP